METKRIPAPPLSPRQPLDSVVKINNAVDRNEVVYCVHEGLLHGVLRSRRHYGVFQVRFADDSKWHAVSQRHVFRKKPKKQPQGGEPPAFEITSHREALEHALYLLVQRTYHVDLAAGPDWNVACRRAQHWSRIGIAGVFFSVEEEVLRCFDEQGTLIENLPFVWEGDLDVIKQCLQETRFEVIESEPLSGRWSQITVSFQPGNV